MMWMKAQIHAQLLVSAGSPMIHHAPIIFVWHLVKFSTTVSIDLKRLLFSIADTQDLNNILHICWLFCNNTSKHLGWHGKEGAFVIWFWTKQICFDPCTENCNFVQAIDARSFGGAKAFCFLFICQWLSSMPNIFRGNRIWWLHHNGFGLITLFSFIILISFLPILDSIDGDHLSNCQSNAAYIYIYIYICL